MRIRHDYSEKELVYHSAMPWYRGIAWRDIVTRTVVTYPIPINVIAGMLHNLWFIFRTGTSDIRYSRECAIYSDAFLRGQLQGHRDAIRELPDELERLLFDRIEQRRST